MIYDDLQIHNGDFFHGKLLTLSEATCKWGLKPPNILKKRKNKHALHQQAESVSIVQRKTDQFGQRGCLKQQRMEVPLKMISCPMFDPCILLLYRRIPSYIIPCYVIFLCMSLCIQKRIYELYCIISCCIIV